MTKCAKMTYASRAEARRDIDHIYNLRRHFKTRCGKSPKDGRRLRVYECPICGKYHLTSQGKRKYA